MRSIFLQVHFVEDQIFSPMEFGVTTLEVSQLEHSLQISSLVPAFMGKAKKCGKPPEVSEEKDHSHSLCNFCPLLSFLNKRYEVKFCHAFDGTYDQGH